MMKSGKDIEGGAMGVESSPDQKRSFFSSSNNSEPGKVFLSILVMDGESYLMGR